MGAPEVDGGTAPDRGNPLWPAIALLAIGLLLTALEWWVETRAAEREAAVSLDRQVHRAQDAILREFRQYEMAVRGGAGLFAASRQVTRDDWKTFVGHLALLRHPGILAMNYARRVPAGEGQALQERLRREGLPGFRIWPQLGDGDSFPIVFTEAAADPQRRILGYDPYSEPARRAAMEKARDTGQPALSGRLTLLQAGAGQPPATGFLLAMPIFKPGLPAGTAAERQAAVDGYVLLIFDAAVALGSVVPEQVVGADIDLEVYGGLVESPAALLFDSDAGRPHTGRYAARMPLDVFGSRWLLLGISGPGFDHAVATSRPQAVAVSGALVSALLAALLWNLVTLRRRAERRAEELAADVRQREIANRALMEQANDGIIVNDLQGRVLDANIKLCEMLGYAREELLGGPVQALLPAEELAARPLRFAELKAGRQFISERPMRRKDGTTLLSETSVKMLADGRVLAIVRDIGERKRAELRLDRLNRLYRTLSETNRVILRLRDRQRLFDELCRIVVDHGGFKFAWVGALVPDNEFLQQAAKHGDDGGCLEGMRISRSDQGGSGSCPLTLAARTGRAEVENDLVAHPVPCCEGAVRAGVSAVAGLPIQCEGRVVGVLAIYAGERNWFDDEMMATLGEITAEVSLALDGIVAQQRQKRADAALRRQAQILDQVHDSVYAIDLAKVVTSWNRGAERLYGYAANEAIGQPVAMLFDEEAFRVLDAQLAGNVREWGGVELELESRRKDGSRLFTRLALSELRDGVGGVKGVLVASTDMTQHRQVEEALRQSETMLKAVIAGVPGMVFSLARDAAGEYAYRHVSAGVAGLFGLTPEAVLERPERIAAAVVDEDRAGFLAALESSSRQGVSLNWEGRISVGGDEKWINVRAAIVPAAEETIWHGLMLNISAQKRSELEARQSREQLRQLSAYLQNTREEEKALIAREIHDELGGTLTALKLDMHWLARQPSGHSGDLRGKIEEMAKLTDGALQTVRRIVSDLRPTILDDLGLAAAIDWQVKEFSKRAGIAVALHLGSADLRLEKKQELALFRMLQEALTNVARHAKATEVTVDFFLLGQRQIVLMVSDDGCGFDSQEVSSRMSHGLRGMMERAADLGGEVVIDSAPGNGTTVSMHLPLGRPAGEGT